jgi:uncharacterized integral membrane protein
MADKDGDKSPISPTLIIGVLIGVAAIDFIAQNRDRVTIHFLFFSFHWRIWVALVITGVASVLAAELVGRAIRKKD